MAVRHVATCGECGWVHPYRSAGWARIGLEAHQCPEPVRVHRRSCRRCGWSGEFTTRPRADAMKRRHSCEWQQALAARRGRGAARRAAMDHTLRPCLHKVADHQHGTYAAYVVDRCRCGPCRTANVTYEATRRRDQAYGRWDNYVDAGPVRDHIRALMAQGMGLPRLVKAYGLSAGQLNKLLYGHPRGDGTRRPPSRRVAKGTAERILAIEFSLADGACVPGGDTARRLQALVASGWSQRRLASRLGILETNFGPVVHGTRDVTVSTARAVHALFVDLVDSAPPASTPAERAAVTRARQQADRMGWAPPLRIHGRAHIGTPLPEPHAEAAHG